MVLFDVMDTLVADPFFTHVAPHLGYASLKELFAVKDPEAWVLFELGQVDEAYLHENFFKDRRSWDLQAMKDLLKREYCYVDGVEELLIRLKANAGVSLHALSNYAPWYTMIEERTKLSRYLEWSFVSAETGLRKPDPMAYTSAAQKLGVEEADYGSVLFVDDSRTNVEAALQLGFDAVLFEGAVGLERALVERGLL